MSNYFKNNKSYELTVATPAGSSVNVPSAKYVEGDFFANEPNLTAVTDAAAATALAADATLLVFSAPSGSSLGGAFLDNISYEGTAFQMRASNAAVSYATNGASTLTLPDSTQCKAGDMLVISNSGNDTLTLTAGAGTTCEVATLATKRTQILVLFGTIWKAAAPVVACS